MRFLLLNQTFYPDVMATGQYLTDLALGLVERGHDVTVVTSRRAYDEPQIRFPKVELWRGIRIYRVASTGFGKGSKCRRAVDFASFSALAAMRLAVLQRHDVVLALTSPPLISFFGACLAKVRGCRFFYWVMDFNPDEAIAAGWLRPGSFPARMLEWMSRFSLRSASKIIALDRFMRDRIMAKGIAAKRVVVLPPWAHDGDVCLDPEGRERFRKQHGLDGKFVVMYSGNHSPCHPLDTLLDSARKLAGDTEIVFCFIGGGTEFRKIQWMVENQRAENGHSPAPHPPISNILCLPYQPLKLLSASLSAADLHVVVMGDPFVGLVHPCKIYNILCVAAPVLYIGPRPSHLSEMLDSLADNHVFAAVGHGEAERVVQEIQRIRQVTANVAQQATIDISLAFSKATIMPKLVAILESS